MESQLTIGPILFHWTADMRRDFYHRIADEAPVGTVYLGEVVCSKRAPFFEEEYADIADRLKRGGKTVVFSSLAEVMVMRERKMTEGLCSIDEFEVEANDASALYHLRGRPHRIGQYVNVYNEESLRKLVANGATHVAVPSELPKEALAKLSMAAKKLNIGLEVQVFGRTGLALSARCYHARAHGRVKDNCQFVCENDPDGMDLQTLGGQEFLSVNGVQTLSHGYLNLMQEMPEMQGMSITHFRLSPHTGDMVALTALFQNVMTGRMEAGAALEVLGKDDKSRSWSNGFYHHKEGYLWVNPVDQGYSTERA